MKILRDFLAVVSIMLLTVSSLWAQEMPIYEWSHDFRRNSGHGVWSDFQSTTDANGNVYLSGVMNAAFDADPGTGVFMLTEANSNYDDVYIIKFNAAGVFQWAHKYDRIGGQNGAGDIIVDASGNVFFASYWQVGFATNDTRLVKFDAAGNELWVKTILTRAWGGRELALDAAGNLLMAGGFNGTVDFDPNAGVESRVASTTGTDSDLFLLKLTTDGNFMWVKTASGPASKRPMAMAIDPSGNIVITGQYNGGTADFDLGAGTQNYTPLGAADVFVLKLEEDGDFIWVRSMGGADTDVASGLAITPAGNIYATGYFRGTADYDPTAGVTTLSTTGETDVYLMRLNPDGSFGWASQFGATGTLPDEGKAIAVDADGNIIVTGTVMGTVDFDPGPGVYNLTGSGTFLRGNAFILKLKEDRTFVWARIFGGSATSDSMGTSIDVDNAGMITVVGHTNGSFQANFGPCSNGEGGSTPYAVVVKLSVGFEAQPTITSISPTSGPVGTQVVITGTNFGTDPAKLDVRFGGNHRATITALTTTSITTTVPASSTSAQVYLKLKCFTGVFTPQTFTVGTPPTPTIISFTPASGNIGATVTITGTNFSTTPPNNTVNFNGTTAVVTASTATSITTTVPAGATTGKITVTVNGITATSANNFTVNGCIAPTITSFTPATGAVGASVTITGTNFSTTPASNTVAFNGTNATVSSATATSLVVAVPGGASSGPISVTTACGTATSANNFTVSTTGTSITVNTQPSNSSSCAGETAAFTVNASGVANIKYQWQFSADGVAAYTDIANATTNQLSVTAGSTSAGFYRARITGDQATEVFSNVARLTINTNGCNPIIVGDLKVYNAISPNGDGKNDILFIESIDVFPDTKTNSVHIFNRWGDEVYTTTDYDNKTRVFSGTGKDGNKLPTGVYYYKIELPDKNQTLTGYIQLKL